MLRERGRFACEYCGVSEADSATELTVDHYRHRSRGGSSAPENLIYACHSCNSHKADYWPVSPEEPSLWNPRVEPSANHFLPIADGTLLAISSVGLFTIDRLQLNRPHLVAYRLAKLQITEPEQAAAERREILAILRVMKEELADTLRENRDVLLELKAWLDRGIRD